MVSLGARKGNEPLWTTSATRVHVIRAFIGREAIMALQTVYLSSGSIFSRATELKTCRALLILCKKIMIIATAEMRGSLDRGVWHLTLDE